MDASQYLQGLKNQLLAEDNWQSIVLQYSWASKFPAKAGVYAIRIKQKGEIVYVGETGSIQGRMRDLLDSRHHQVRRTLGKRLYVKIEGFVHATSKLKFPDHIEVMLNKHMSEELQIAFLPVDLGRKELEELIIGSLSKDQQLNNREKRGQIKK